MNFISGLDPPNFKGFLKIRCLEGSQQIWIQFVEYWCFVDLFFGGHKKFRRSPEFYMPPKQTTWGLKTSYLFWPLQTPDFQKVLKFGGSKPDMKFIYLMLWLHTLCLSPPYGAPIPPHPVICLSGGGKKRTGVYFFFAPSIIFGLL